MRIDLPLFISKYIGETERNRDEVRGCALCRGCVPVFDDAHAVFGRRGEARDG